MTPKRENGRLKVSERKEVLCKDEVGCKYEDSYLEGMADNERTRDADLSNPMGHQCL